MRKDLSQLISSILEADKTLGQQAARAVNVSLTLRNWLIGFYIAEYELHGSDRAQYGEKLLERLAERLSAASISRSEVRELRRYKLFYSVYPDVIELVPDAFKRQFKPTQAIRESATPEFKVSIQDIVHKLSFTHLVELIAIEDNLKRYFFELQATQGHWSVRELKRQISSLLFERTALSDDKHKLLELTNASAEQSSRLEVRDPYIFKFLGIKANETVTESVLEHGLLGKIQEFILELGNGFCFEARQKRILIGHETFFVDLVFYHRILKCHVLIELKLGKFTHEHIGQLNTYVTWYKRHMMSEGDNPPVGILLCSEKDHGLVEYALAGMNNDLFVSKYLLELPSQETIARFLAELQEGE